MDTSLAAGRPYSRPFAVLRAARVYLIYRAQPQQPGSIPKLQQLQTNDVCVSGTQRGEQLRSWLTV